MRHRAIDDHLLLVTDAAREIVAAHQATTSLAPGGKWKHAIHAVSLSDKYAAWRAYAEPPAGSGIYHLVPALNRPMRMTQAELERHPAWRAFGVAPPGLSNGRNAIPEAHAPGFTLSPRRGWRHARRSN